MLLLTTGPSSSDFPTFSSISIIKSKSAAKFSLESGLVFNLDVTSSYIDSTSSTLYQTSTSDLVSSSTDDSAGSTPDATSDFEPATITADLTSSTLNQTLFTSDLSSSTSAETSTIIDSNSSTFYSDLTTFDADPSSLDPATSSTDLTTPSPLPQILVDCKYTTGDYRGYKCNVQSLEITSIDHRIISGNTGSHLANKNNDDVHFFESNGKTCVYFPKNLENIFKFLSTIHIEKAGMVEITREDFKPFGEALTELWLGQNEIEVIPPGLFDFNPNLVGISFSQCKIKVVAEGVMSELTKLARLDFNINPCHGGYAYSHNAAIQLADDMARFCKSERLRRV